MLSFPCWQSPVSAYYHHLRDVIVLSETLLMYNNNNDLHTEIGVPNVIYSARSGTDRRFQNGSEIHERNAPEWPTVWQGCPRGQCQAIWHGGSCQGDRDVPIEGIPDTGGAAQSLDRPD